MRQFFFIFSLTLLSSTAAFANAIQPTEESFSRALQLAKRVAALENDNDIPSRAIVLGQRVAKNSQNLAFQTKKPEPKRAPRKHVSPSVKN